MPIAESPTSVDMFCGVGGLSYGMGLAGVRVAAGIDIDPSCSHSFETNVGGRFIHQDVTKLLPETVKALYDGCSVRVLSGCAPCQPFSSYASRYTQAMDWPLLGKFWEVASALRPEIVTIENVPRLSKSLIFSEFLAQLTWAGYCYDYQIVNCAEYGVPQKRKRLVLLASRLGPITMGPKTHEVSDFGTGSRSDRPLGRFGGRRGILHRSLARRECPFRNEFAKDTPLKASRYVEGLAGEPPSGLSHPLDGQDISQRIRPDDVGSASSDHYDSVSWFRQWAIRASGARPRNFATRGGSPSDFPRNLLIPA